MSVGSDSARLRFALEHVAVDQWRQFENFCNAYLASEFEELRPVSGVGDLGRDAVLFGTHARGVVLQYSIASDWKAKIRHTVTRLREAEVYVHLLIYATNQSIGPRVDDLRPELLKLGVSLDLRDRDYFVSRIHRTPATRAAALELSKAVVDPLLAAEGLVQNSAVSDPDMRAGLLYLELLAHDLENGRNLTKLCGEALVLNTLSDTGPTVRKTRREVTAEVESLFPGSDADRVEQVTDGALERLRQRNRVRYTRSDDSYALHQTERERLIRRAGILFEGRERVREALSMQAAQTALELEVSTSTWESDQFVSALEKIFEEILHRRGNEFVEALSARRTSLSRVDLYDLSRTVLSSEAESLQAKGEDFNQLFELATECVDSIIRNPSEVLQRYLRELADAYTLLAFLKVTPDVQRAVDRLVGDGLLVLDTTVVLPCFGEVLLPEDQRRFANLLSAARRAGLQLRVTRGVLEEIDSHLKRSAACYRMQAGRWLGGEPFTLRQWRDYGGSGDFEGFVSHFSGRDHPIDDIGDFLHTYVDVEMASLEAGVNEFPMELRGSFTELWRERKPLRPGLDEADMDILLRNDVEMYLGVLGERKKSERGVFGYTNWWVTVDASAFAMLNVARRNGLLFDSSPSMHPEFLSNVLTVGTQRRDSLANARRFLPVALNIQHQGWGVPELSKLAAQIRTANAGSPEWAIRRKIRDGADKVRATNQWRVVPVPGEDVLVTEES